MFSYKKEVAATVLGIVALTAITIGINKSSLLSTYNSSSLTAAVSGAGSGLKAHYTFDDGNGTILSDSAGSNQGTLMSGPAWTSGKIGGALSFNGTNWVDLGNPSALQLNNRMTISVWVNPDSSQQSNWGRIISKTNGATGDNWSLALTDNRIPSFRINNTYTNPSSSISANNWSHLVGTFDGTTARLYVNGVLIHSFAQSGPITTSGDITLGRNSTSENRYFQGKIDELRIYDRAILDCEVKELFDGTPCESTPPNQTDTTAPTTPGIPIASSITLNSVTLSWSASTDNVAVVGYRIYRGGNQIGTSTNTTYTDSSVSPSSTYSYTIYAYDGATPANVSEQSGARSVTTSNTGTNTIPSGTTRTVACSGDITTALQNAVNSSVTGDTVQISAGSCSTSRITMNDKNITVIGAGKGVTVISANNFLIISASGANNPRFRISSMTLTGSAIGAVPIEIWGVESSTMRGPFRIDNINFNYPNSGSNGHVKFWGPIYGLVDNNDFTHAGGTTFLTNMEVDTETCSYNFAWKGGGCSLSTLVGRATMSLPYEPGGVRNIYIENNTFTGLGTNGVFASDTGYAGGRYVFRKNTFTNTGLYAHWTSANAVNHMWLEAYDNVFVNTSLALYPMRFQGGGTGLIYNNTITGYPSNYILLGEGRNPAQGQSGSPLGYCDGTHNWDGNLDPSAPGWPCLSQTGRDAGKTFEQIQSGNKQASFPLYLWNNGPQAKCANPSASGNACDNSFGVGVAFGFGSHIKSSQHPNGDVDWSKTTSKPVGAGTHTLNYTPYQYPHPLQTGITTPNSPTISSISVIPNSNNSVTINWTTNQFANSRIDYGLTTVYGSNVLNSTEVTSHSLTTSPNLTPNTLYNYKITSTNSAGTAVSTNLTFTTTDTTPPSLLNITASNITTSAATISWTTNEPATTRVEYGTGLSYGTLTPYISTLNTIHIQNISTLQPNTTYNYRVISTDAAGNTSTSANGTFTTPAVSDTTRPIVSVTAPTGTISGSVNFSATASDPSVTGQVTSGLQSIQLMLDGVAYGSPSNTSPLTLPWNTIAALNGSHILTAVARDHAGNVTTSAPVTVTVNNVATTLTIGNVVITPISKGRLQISWTTNTPSNSFVDLGTSASYGTTLSNTSLVTNHVITTGSLNRDTLYYLRIRSNTSNLSAVTTTTYRTPAGPGKIKSISATGGSIILNWENPAVIDYENVVIYRASGSTPVENAFGTPLATVGTTITTYRDESVLPETTYSYTLFTKDSDGAATLSGTVTFTSPKKPIAAPSTSRDGGRGSSNVPPPNLVTTITSIPGCPTNTICTPSTQTPSSATTAFFRTLTVGSSGTDVKALQVFLNSKGYTVATSGAGSRGLETSYFGPATQRALIRFQVANNITPANGILGSLTRSRMNADK